MSKFNVSILITIILNFLTIDAQAQDGYTYTLIDNGSFSYTIAAVPNTSTSNFATSVQSYGFTILLPDGITASIISSLGNGAGATFFDGNAVGQPTIDGYLITETLGSPISLPAPVNGMMSTMVTIQLDQSPTSGSISILENDTALATTITPLKSFMSADMIDDDSAVFTPVVDANGSGISGTFSYDFSTLSVETNNLSEILTYPNPVKDIIHVTNANTELMKAEIYNLNGQLILHKEKNIETINTSMLPKGIYVLKLYTEKAYKTIKIFKE